MDIIINGLGNSYNIAICQQFSVLFKRIGKKEWLAVSTKNRMQINSDKIITSYSICDESAVKTDLYTK